VFDHVVLEFALCAVNSDWCSWEFSCVYF